MTAILHTAGPVSTRYAIRQNWRFLRKVPPQEFCLAATDLQSMNLGTLVTLRTVNAIASKVFIKRAPSDVIDILMARPDLRCLPDLYRERYRKPAAKAITFAVRARLIKMKLVPEKQLI